MKGIIISRWPTSPAKVNRGRSAGIRYPGRIDSTLSFAQPEQYEG